MILSPAAPNFPDWCDVLAAAYRNGEEDVVAELLADAPWPGSSRTRVAGHAYRLVAVARKSCARKGGIDALTSEYDLSTQEGLALMCLAEALLRIPDANTADQLIHDKLTGGDWGQHLGRSKSAFVNASTIGLMLTSRILNAGSAQDQAGTPQAGTLRRFVARLGAPAIRQAMRQAMRIMGRQFVLGRTIAEAQGRGAAQEKNGYRYSYDMLGEAARTEDDARRYFDAYERAIHAIGQASNGRGVIAGPGISVKLSALHPRYEAGKRLEILDVLVGRTLKLAQLAKRYDIGFCVDAEEADRLELSLEIIERVYTDPLLEGWSGFGLAVQTYQKRARQVIDILATMVKRTGRRMNVRLVKGAYWDSEIKRAQESGMSDYAVYTRKVTTDVSYLVCAKRLFAYQDLFFPQFATHNAHTAASILEMAQGRPFEFQRLHGMGAELYDEIVPAHKANVPCRIYAPVGGHAELLSYLVRRLLENGANSSFVNQMADDSTPIKVIIADPLECLINLEHKRHPSIALPADLYGAARRNAQGVDLTDSRTVMGLAADMSPYLNMAHTAGPIVGGTLRSGAQEPVVDPADLRRVVGNVTEATRQDREDALARAEAAWPSWSAAPPQTRAKILGGVADALEARMAEFMSICVREAGKTLPDAQAEVREAIDFLRYYAVRAPIDFDPVHAFVDESGRGTQARLRGCGVVLCISPWNFPLAIFTGQVAAALAAGNAVMAKPAEQTPLVAAKMVRLFHDCGVPGDVLALLPGRGETVGAALVKDSRISGVAFTGSVEVARSIAQSLAARPTGKAVLIAETGGMNAMITDSSALPEQVIRDVVLSAFGSAGQRCSALRVLYVQDDVAEPVIAMLKGAMQTLTVSEPSCLATDVGPVIDDEAKAALEAHVARMDRDAELIHVCDLSPSCENGSFFAPRAYVIEGIHVLEREVFGPVLHVVRYAAKDLDKVVNAVRETGYGLTMGIHTRIDARARHIQRSSHIGNTYVNRSMIGAVVGVQPFGGEGLSGSGPKAGGPHYLPRFAAYAATHEGDDSGREARRIIALEAAKLLPAELDPPLAAMPGRALQTALDNATRKTGACERTRLERRVEMVTRITAVVTAEAAAIAALAARDGGQDLAVPVGQLVQAILYLPILAAQAERELAAPEILPGPTGEHNELQLHPRGVILVIAGKRAQMGVTLSQIAAALCGGNAVVVAVVPKLAAALRKAIGSVSGQAIELVVVDSDTMIDQLNHPFIAAIAIAGSAELERKIAMRLASRPGVILNLISEPVGPYLLRNFVSERCLTIDMTAAGGNATLMILDDDAPLSPPLSS